MLKCDWCGDEVESVKDVEYLPEGESFTLHADLCENCEDSLEYVPEPETQHSRDKTP